MATVINSVRTLAISAAALAAVATISLPEKASAALFEIDFSDGGSGPFGTFNAPAGGGPVTNLMVTLSGVLFDTMLPGTTSFTYDPTVVDFRWMGNFPAYTNSLAVPGVCVVGTCFLEIYPTPDDPTVPGDYLAIDANLNNLGPGTQYAINPNPVPIPAALSLAAAGIGALVVLSRRRKTAPEAA